MLCSSCCCWFWLVVLLRVCFLMTRVVTYASTVLTPLLLLLLLLLILLVLLSLLLVPPRVCRWLLSGQRQLPAADDANMAVANGFSAITAAVFLLVLQGARLASARSTPATLLQAAQRVQRAPLLALRVP
jgi:type IV secretory pathway TrbL component